MTTFRLPSRDDDLTRQQNLDALLTAINAIAQFVDFGTGVPTYTPTGRRIFIRLDGGAGTTLYCWSGAAWNAFA